MKLKTRLRMGRVMDGIRWRYTWLNDEGAHLWAPWTFLDDSETDGVGFEPTVRY